jgi:hypothetical protein
MLTFAEYNFIRAEAALRFTLQEVHKRFSSGCKSFYGKCWCSSSRYYSLATNGTLTGTDAQN